MDDVEQVEIPVTPNPLTLEQMEALKRTVQPLQLCDDYGIELYILARAFVRAVVV